MATYVGPVERPSTRTPRRTAPPPRPAAEHPAGVAVDGAGVDGDLGESATVYRSRTTGPLPEPLLAAVRRLPEPKLTGFGTGMLTALTMLAVGCLDALLLSRSPVVYGLFFLLVCAASAVWVRPADLIVAPVSVPIAFAVGLVPLGDGGEGFGGRAMNLVTTLSLEVGWLYAGTLVTCLIVLVRRIALVGRRQRRAKARRAAGSRAGGSAGGRADGPTGERTGGAVDGRLPGGPPAPGQPSPPAPSPGRAAEQRRAPHPGQ